MITKKSNPFKEYFLVGIIGGFIFIVLYASTVRTGAYLSKFADEVKGTGLEENNRNIISKGEADKANQNTMDVKSGNTISNENNDGTVSTKANKAAALEEKNADSSMETAKIISAVEADRTKAILFEKKNERTVTATQNDEAKGNSLGVNNGPNKMNADNPEISRFHALTPLLSKAAMEDRTVILTSTNHAYSEPNSLLDMFLDSFHNGIEIEHLLNHLIIVAMDEKAFERCQSLHPYCYLVEHKSTNFTLEKSYMSADYIELVWTKVKIWQFVLQQGYNVFFTDADILWFRNPFHQVSAYADMTIGADKFKGDPESHDSDPNTGIIHLKAVQRNIDLLKELYDARSKLPPAHEQMAFHWLRQGLCDKFKVKFMYVDTAYWGGTCEPKKDYSRLCTFHAICMQGLEVKKQALADAMNEWKAYKVSVINKQQ